MFHVSIFVQKTFFENNTIVKYNINNIKSSNFVTVVVCMLSQNCTVQNNENYYIK